MILQRAVAITGSALGSSQRVCGGTGVFARPRPEQSVIGVDSVFDETLSRRQMADVTEDKAARPFEAIQSCLVVRC
jgi:hypothetical protein